MISRNAKTVLIAGSANVTGINTIRSLIDHYNVIGCDNSEHNAANLFCENFIFPPTTDSQYIEKIFDLIKSKNIFAIIASNDHDARALFHYKNEIRSYGVSLNADYHLSTSFLDKKETSDIFKKHNILTPKIVEKNSNFPFVVRKKKVGGQKKFTYIVNSKEDKKKISKAEWESSVITEFVKGDEYTVDIISGLDSELISVVPRLRREIRAGMVHFAEIVKNEKVISNSEILAKRLQLTGINCVQCIENEEGCYFFEVNPRPGSGIDLSIKAGVNMPLIWVNSVLGKKNNPIQPEWGLKLIRYFDGYFFK